MKISEKNKQSNNISCRLEKNIYEGIIEDARLRGISINSLISSILANHLKFGKFTDDLEFLPITRRTIKKIFRYLNEDEIEEIAYDVGGVVAKQLTFFKNPKLEFEELMMAVEISARRFGVVRHYINGNTHNFNIRHGVSENFSKFLISTHKILSNQLELRYVVHNVDRSMVCIEIEKP